MNKAFLSVLIALGLVCVISGTPLQVEEFETYILPRCFNNSEKTSLSYVNGQLYPLASTLDNFIHLVEKLEAANPNMKLQDELLFLINNFTIYNLLYGQDGKFVKNLLSGSRDVLDALWEINGQDPVIPAYEIPFTDDEFCCLYNMLSHTINDTTAWFDNAEGFYAKFLTFNTNNTLRSDETVGVARELGVVSVRGTNHTVALGRVITGLYFGLQSGQTLKTLKDLLPDRQFARLPDDLRNGNPVADPLYLFTMIEPLSIAMLDVSGNKGLYPNGEWRYIRNASPQKYDVPEICPTIYEVSQGNYYLSSLASVRGGIDGLVLGTVVSRNKDMFKDRRLSEILRQYYSYAGVSDKTAPTEPASFCRRLEFLNELVPENILANHSEIYVVLAIQQVSRLPSVLPDILNEFKNKKDAILELEGALKGYCNSKAPSDDRKTTCETPVDVIIALDEEMTEYFRKQQRIIGHLANMIDLWSNGSSVTVLSNNENVGTYLQFMETTSSRACLACQITQRDQGSGTPVKTAKVVEAVERVLMQKKAEQNKRNGAPGKVVIFFNYKEKEPESSELDHALNKLRATHMDTSIIGVGKSEQVIKKFTGFNNMQTIISGVGDDKEIAQKLAERICIAPAALQYEFCKYGDKEDEAVFNGLVSTNAKQYWSMDPKYFEKSTSMSITFEVTGGGDLQVCKNRGSKPEADVKNCEVLPVGAKKTFPESNPCSGVSRLGCSPIAFYVYGLENKTQDMSGQYCDDLPAKEGGGDVSLYCKRLDQIAFRVSHKGVRCSGCMALFCTPFLVSVALILCSIFSKLY